MHKKGDKSVKFSSPAGDTDATVWPVRIVVLGSVVALLAGCGWTSNAVIESDVARGEKTVSRAVARCAEGSVHPIGNMRQSLAAVVTGSATLYRTPGRTPFARLGKLNVNGVPTVLAVRAKRLGRRCSAGWYHVQVAQRPNGTLAWVRAGDVDVVPVTTRIEVDLSARTVTLFDRGRRVLSTRAAIGSSATPTPTGRYYVNQRLIPTDSSGPFGPGAIGISAFSPVLTGWAQGGPIAIHGTNRPELIGLAVSNGCIRVRNDALRRLFDRTLAGTPVLVRT
jgi:hypothetical protein